MAVTLADLAQFVRGSGSFRSWSEGHAAKALEAAEELVVSYLRGGIAPASVMDLAILQTASELVIRADSPAGFRMMADGVSTGRMANDPMRSTYAVLAPYRGLGEPL